MADAEERTNRALITVDQISKSYTKPTGEHIQVLDGLSFDIRAGKVIGIVGPSGCGKSTLLRLVAGLEIPERGTVIFHDSRQPPPVPMVLQTPALLPWRTVHDNIKLGLEFLALQNTDAKTQAYVTLMGLEGFDSFLPKDLSGGMKARVSIGRALVTANDLVLFDEAFTELDEVTRQTLNDIFCEHVEKSGLAAVVVSHDIAETVYLADEILILTKRPCQIAKRVTIELRRPRKPGVRLTREFEDIVHALRKFAINIWK